ncbi:MAG: PAS domain S-box protein [Syntrophobacteraceae bacterium]|nr:PAS domain S-box protein [Syntrophobacteraceae bacterium]
MANKRAKPCAGNDWKIRLFDYLSAPTIILSPDRIIVDVNASFLENFLTDKSHVVGRTCHDFFFGSPQPCPTEICGLAKVLADRRGHSALKSTAAPGDIETWDNHVFSPVLDEAGEVTHVVTSIHDVTPIKQLERRLAGARDFTEKLIQSSTTAIFAADMKGRILTMNPAAEELVGYTLEEAQKKITAEDLYPAGRAKEVMKILRDERMGGKGKLHLTRFTLINAAGEEIPVDLTGAIIYEGDTEVATVGLFNDLREKLQQEQRDREMAALNARMEKMASLGQLAAGVAHEINNPLTGILFYATLLLESLAEDDPRRKSLTQIYEDARRCGRIIKNLLAYSRQEPPRKEILNLNAVLEKSLALIRDREFYVDLRVIRELSGEMILIEADGDQLGQVFVNLVLNGVDAMEQKGTLTLRTYPDKSGRNACIEISDTGCGIAQENLTRLFDPFFTTKAPGKGTGLGLSTAYGIVRENGGNLWVKETGEHGTTFVVELPLYKN